MPATRQREGAAASDTDQQEDKWGFAPGRDDTLELNLEHRGSRLRIHPAFAPFLDFRLLLDIEYGVSVIVDSPSFSHRSPCITQASSLKMGSASPKTNPGTHYSSWAAQGSS